MSERLRSAADRSDETSDPDTVDPAVQSERLEQLTAENERLRRQYRDAQRTRYRRTALGLAAVGAVAVLGGVVLAGSRDVLFVLGSIGLFGALLTYYLTPEQFIAADLGERIYAPLARNEARLVAELGLTDTRLYVPTDGDPPAWLYVPQREEYELPDAAALDSTLVVDESERARGVSFEPTGGELFREFERTLTGSLVARPRLLATQIADGIVEGFELAERADTDVDVDGGRLSIAIRNGAYGGADQFDEPITSFVAVALATTLEQPIRVERTDRSETEHVVTCYWEPDDESE